MSIAVVLAALAGGALIGAATVGVKLWRYGFPEHRRARSRAAFECQQPFGVITQRLLGCAGAQRGWRVELADPAAIRVHAGATLFAWCKRIEISVRGSTDVSCIVSIGSSSPQIYDWGDNSRAVAVLRASVADAIWPA